MEAVKATQGKITGVIIPPPEIRAVVDKTALFVAKNGKSFEQRILNSSEGQTAKFNFMKPFDPYHAYYEMKIREGEEGVSSNGAEEAKGSDASEANRIAKSNDDLAKEKAAAQAAAAAAASSSVATSVKATILNPIAQLAKTKPTEAPAELDFIATHSHPAGLSALDVDVIKLTAQYTAVNGREFLASLALREQRNPQFDFLKPTHMLFSYFTSLVDAYAKILHPSAALRECIELKSSSWDSAMQGAVVRWLWERQEEERRRQQQSEGEVSAERMAFLAIDWFDFTVVETIDFPEDELLEVPGLSAIDIGSNGNGSYGNINNGSSAIAAGKVNVRAAVEEQGKEEEENDEDEDGGNNYYGNAAGVSGAYNNYDDRMVEEEDLSDLKVVADYQHPSSSGGGGGSGSNSAGADGTAGGGLMMIDPISGKAVSVDQMSEHMRVQLLDPRWRQQQQRFIDKQKETGYAEGGSIADSLKMFARKRGDIFGQAATGAGPNSAAAIAEQAAIEARKAEVSKRLLVVL